MVSFYFFNVISRISDTIVEPIFYGNAIMLPNSLQPLFSVHQGFLKLFSFTFDNNARLICAQTFQMQFRGTWSTVCVTDQKVFLINFGYWQLANKRFEFLKNQIVRYMFILICIILYIFKCKKAFSIFIAVLGIFVFIFFFSREQENNSSPRVKNLEFYHINWSRVTEISDGAMKSEKLKSRYFYFNIILDKRR